MNIVTFEKQHIEEAKAIAFANYQQEWEKVPCLPRITRMPELTWFAENGLGVAAIENGELIGFLCCVGAFDNAFGSGVKGTFSPIHAHGALTEGRVEIYRRMYQAAAQIWVDHGIMQHAIALYAHDSAAQEALFLYGFGARCADAIRDMEQIRCGKVPGIVFRELPKEELIRLRPMRNALHAHLGESPCFLDAHNGLPEKWILNREQGDYRVFAAETETDIAAYIEVCADGENFLTEAEDMANICGAFCWPRYRGTGIFAQLLNFCVDSLRREGFQRLGVDHETANPTALAAWSKYFTHYTYSLVRRIEECAARR